MLYFDKDVEDRSKISKVINKLPIIPTNYENLSDEEEWLTEKIYMQIIDWRIWEEGDHLSVMNIIRHKYINKNLLNHACYIRDHLQTHCLN